MHLYHYEAIPSQSAHESGQHMEELNNENGQCMTVVNTWK